MFNTVSKAGVGMYVTAIVVLLNLIGIDVDEGLVTEAVMGVIAIVGLLAWVYGQFDRKDLKLGLFRK